MICHQCLDKSIANWSSLDVCSCSCRAFEQGAGWLFEFILMFESEYDFVFDTK